MSKTNLSGNFLNVLEKLKENNFNPFSHCDRLKNNNQIKLVNLFGTYEDLYEEVRCPICLSRVSSAIRPKNCLHIFCLLCLKKWIKMSNKCPVCRRPIDKIIEVDVKESWVTFQGNLFALYS